MNLLEQQASNRRRTWLVMAAFILFLLALGFGFDRFLLGIQGVPVPVGSIVSFGVGSLSVVASYFAGDRAVLLSAGAIPVGQLLEQNVSEDRRLKFRQLQNIVDEMAIASGLPAPAVYIVPDPDPNAFATGRDPEHASLAVTMGLLDTLNRDELQGVVAHEMSHIRNYDIRLMTVIAALVGAVALLSDWASRGLFYGSGRSDRDDRKGGGLLTVVVFAVWVVAVLLAPFIGQLLAMAVSRRREYLADASGAELTRNPIALGEALQKIDRAIEPTRSIKRGSAHLCIGDPLAREVDNREGFLADLLASHPPMVRRIEALRQMAFAG